uniref:Uncharacterized protein n=1 Tax=Oncorhynchus tshawytscha TaxID=74940 RepID=A0AAZ3SUU1_ONCTS
TVVFGVSCFVGDILNKGSCTLTTLHLGPVISLTTFVTHMFLGSSHGQTCIIHKVYDEDYYTHMMEECYQLWSQLEKEDNMLYADRTLKTGQFQKLGGVIKDGQKVIDITPGAMVTVTTVSGVYIAMSLVITAGPWANILLSHTGCSYHCRKVIKMNVCYWREQIPGSYNVQHRFPCFIQLESEEAKNYIYCLLSNEYPGLMKVWTCRYHNTDLDKRNRQTDLLILSGLHVPSHRFKFGPIVEVPSYYLSHFRIRLFQAHSKSAL